MSLEHRAQSTDRMFDGLVHISKYVREWRMVNVSLYWMAKHQTLGPICLCYTKTLSHIHKQSMYAMPCRATINAGTPQTVRTVNEMKVLNWYYIWLVASIPFILSFNVQLTHRHKHMHMNANYTLTWMKSVLVKFSKMKTK